MPLITAAPSLVMLKRLAKLKLWESINSLQILYKPSASLLFQEYQEI